MNQRADAAAARELIESAVDVLAEADPDIRFEAFKVAAAVAQWLSDADAFEKWARLGLEAARAADRKDQELQITVALAESYVYRLEFAEAEPLIDRSGELADESMSIVGRALAWAARGTLENWRGNDAEAEIAFTAAHDLYAEIGNRAQEASMALSIARHAAALGDLSRAEQLLLEAVRTMKGLMDRSRLCEAQRSLAELYVRLGRLEEAERYALEARESVGPDDRSSITTTKLSLGVVRAAQGRDDEAAELMHEAVDDARCTDQRALERWALGKVIEFHRSRGQDEEVRRYEERLVELMPSAAPMA